MANHSPTTATNLMLEIGRDIRNGNLDLQDALRSSDIDEEDGETLVMEISEMMDIARRMRGELETFEDHCQKECDRINELEQHAFAVALQGTK